MRNIFSGEFVLENGESITNVCFESKKAAFYSQTMGCRSNEVAPSSFWSRIFRCFVTLFKNNATEKILHCFSLILFANRENRVLFNQAELR